MLSESATSDLQAPKVNPTPGALLRETPLSKSPNEPTALPETEEYPGSSIDRRGFLTSGVAAGAAAVVATPVQPAAAAEAIAWDHEVDVLVIGAGAGGLVAAIAARKKGASVIIVEKNFDIGGRAMMSFGGLYIGGGNKLQKAIGVEDTPDLVFADWSRPEKPMGRFSGPGAGAYLCGQQSRFV
jgi:NADPH-dependent 2,4-dienoyl-CoA reductase/sulfur reductase-like enzyme